MRSTFASSSQSHDPIGQEQPDWAAVPRQRRPNKAWARPVAEPDFMRADAAVQGHPVNWAPRVDRAQLGATRYSSQGQTTLPPTSVVARPGTPAGAVWAALPSAAASTTAGAGIAAVGAAAMGVLLLMFAHESRNLELFAYPQAIAPDGLLQMVHHTSRQFAPSAANNIARLGAFAVSFGSGLLCLAVAGQMTHRVVTGSQAGRVVDRWAL